MRCFQFFWGVINSDEVFFVKGRNALMVICLLNMFVGWELK